VDQELKQLALLALKNAFYRDFSALANAYLEAAEGLGDADLAAHLAEMANMFSRDVEADGDMHPNIWTQNDGSFLDTTGHLTLYEALSFERATEVHLQGTKVFKRLDGEWYFTGGED
jgi:hypothetical protein